MTSDIKNMLSPIFCICLGDVLHHNRFDLDQHRKETDSNAVNTPIIMSIVLCADIFGQTITGPKGPAEVAALQGVYTGSWASYGVDAYASGEHQRLDWQRENGVGG